ncbi:ATP-binding protein [Streptomyces sp. CT34]|uniref:ATP-binding protein n=1 Tax=Streptomyces sp. CT34 TaxID=1553907 RepID=UPI0007C6B31F|nr:ATP-binding protein [Streptomyces sp. CT34]
MTTEHHTTTAEQAEARYHRQAMTAEPEEIGCVRRSVTAFMRYCGWGALTGPAVLCVTEMLTNVRRHADSDECALLVHCSPSGVRIVVSDGSPDLPVLREPDPLSERGRGMFLLAHTADAWGAAPTATGKDVWVEFRAASVESAARSGAAPPIRRCTA